MCGFRRKKSFRDTKKLKLKKREHFSQMQQRSNLATENPEKKEW